jgi:hypothetical protein
MKFNPDDWGRRVRMHNPPEDRMLSERGTLIGYHAQEKNKVVVQSDRRYNENDNGVRLCDEDYVDLIGE